MWLLFTFSSNHASVVLGFRDINDVFSPQGRFGHFRPVDSTYTARSFSVSNVSIISVHWRKHTYSGQSENKHRTRHRARRSMYSLTFCVRFLLTERHQWQPAVQTAAVMLRKSPRRRPITGEPATPTSHIWRAILRTPPVTHPPVTGHLRAQTPPRWLND